SSYRWLTYHSASGWPASTAIRVGCRPPGGLLPFILSNLLEYAGMISSTQPFCDLPQTPDTHFKLYFYAAVLRVIEQVMQSFDSPEATFEQFPFLAGYMNELAWHGL